MSIIALVLLTLLGRVLYLQFWLGNSVRIRTETKGWLTWEVRRRVLMEKMPQHVSEFPMPREERVRACRLFGLALWHSEMSIGLPGSACANLERIPPQDFDKEFPIWLRMAKSAG